MKIVIDVDRHLREGRISEVEHRLLKDLAEAETPSTTLNSLVCFGVVAAAVGVLTLLPTPQMAILQGLVLAAWGITLRASNAEEWGLLASVLLLVGTLMAAGGLHILADERFDGLLYVTLLCLTAAVLGRSSLLMAIAALSLAATLESALVHVRPMRSLMFLHPAATILVFGLLAWLSHRLSLWLEGDHKRLAIAFNRTSLLLVNLGFWLGSLAGDFWWPPEAIWASGPLLPDWGFAIVWAIGLLATAVWAIRNGRHRLVNILAVLGTIHVFSQYYARLGGELLSLLVAGGLVVGFVFALVNYNLTTHAAVHPSPSSHAHD